jgi:hypothetical protein
MREEGLVERGSITFFFEILLGCRRLCSKQPQRRISHMATRITGVMAGNTTADHDFLALDDFNIVPILLWRETTQ